MTLTLTSTWQALDLLATDVFQTRAWAAADVAMCPGEPVPLVCSLSNGVVLVPTIRRDTPVGRVLFSPYGYPGIVRAVDGPLSMPELVGSLQTRVRAAGARALLLRLHPVHDADLPGIDLPHAAVVQHGATAAIDLRRGTDSAWSAMRGRTRSYVRRAERDGFTVRVDAWDEDFDGFRRAYDESMERVGAHQRYRFADDYWDRLRELGPERLRLLTTRAPDGTVAAGIVVTHFDAIANYHLGGTRTAHLDHHLLELLLWRAAELLGGEAELLHLGGGVGARNDGLLQMKRGLGRRGFIFRTLRLAADPWTFTGGAEHIGALDVRTPDFPALAQ